MGDAAPARVRSTALTRVLGVAAAFLTMVAIAFEAMDYPATYSCAGTPPPEATEQRNDYLPGALAVVCCFGVGFGILGWRWTAERARRLGRAPAPAPLTGVFALAMAGLWAALVVTAITSEAAGGPYLGAILIGIAGSAALAVLGVVLLFHLAFVLPTSTNWAARCETLTVAAMWVFLLSVYPVALVAVAVAAKDVTLFC